MSPALRRPYTSRVVDAQLARLLESAGAVLIEGPKACGKTSTAERVTASHVYLDMEAAAREAIQIDPSLVLNAEPPQLIDEWQLEATRVWNYVRDQVNRRRATGQFILTGSAVPDDDAARHTGAGRIDRLRMRPMSLFESGESTGVQSLAALLAGERPTSPSTPLSVADVADLTVRGGWPLSQHLTGEQAARACRSYLKNVAEVDVARVDPSRRDPELAMRLFRALARNTALDHKIARISAEAEGANPPPARSTAYDYINAFQRLMVLENQPPWSTHLRSRASLRRAARTHFVDPSLAIAALGGSASALLADLKSFGYLFESLVLRDCRIYADPLEGTVYHYRDSDDLEIDIIVATPRAWGAFEVKLGVGHVDAAAANLVAFAAKVDTAKIGPPAVLGVITATGYGYTRPDGVVVVPIGALGP